MQLVFHSGHPKEILCQRKHNADLVLQDAAYIITQNKDMHSNSYWETWTKLCWLQTHTNLIV